MNFFDFSISVEKLKIIIKIQFLKIFRLLKIYLNFIDYFWNYVLFYVEIFKTLQVKKIELLKFFLIFNNARKVYFNRIKINNFTLLKFKFFCVLQLLFFDLLYFIHYNSTRQLFVNLNANKKFNIETIVYYVKLFVN